MKKIDNDILNELGNDNSLLNGNDILGELYIR